MTTEPDTPNSVDNPDESYRPDGAVSTETTVVLGRDPYRSRTVRNHTRNDGDFYINITGGTNLVAGGATSSAFFVGATPYYVLEPQGEDETTEELVMTLPAPTQPVTFEVEGLQREVLVCLSELENSGRTDVIMREVGENIGESPQKISYHINRLEERGLVEKRASGRSKYIHLTDVGQLYLQWTADTDLS